MDIDISNPDDLRRAIQKVYKHIQENGPSPEAYLDLANFHAFLNEFEKACEILQGAIETWPQNQMLKNSLERLPRAKPDNSLEKRIYPALDDLLKFIRCKDYAEARLLLETVPDLLSLHIDDSIQKAASILQGEIAHESWKEKVELLFYCRKFGKTGGFIKYLQISKEEILDDMIDLWRKFGECPSYDDAVIFMDEHTELESNISFFAVAELIITSQETNDMQSYNTFKQRLEVLRKYKSLGY